ncbi:MAG: DUF3536 domain-containing protein [Aquificaceae bacterium]
MNFLCVHCHFHQPPRENPYLGLIPIEDSAFPFENWNERIFRESYLPNLYAHYVRDRKIIKIINNYERISFNFTYSLLSWLLREKPWFVQRLKEAGRNALASGFNHTILPLDPEEDREVQIVWGIKAFEKVFGRKPRGFWLPELAMDRKTLSLLVKHGIRYVILAPHQVKKRKSYLRHHLPEGHIDIFVYDGELSHGIAFGELINDMEGVIRSTKDRKKLTLIAVDGETFGHHKKFGEMGLAYLLENHPHITTLEELLDLVYPEDETDIKEFTSWSCEHGVERWRSNCGCSTGGQAHWHQEWRKPLREALEVLRSKVKERLFQTLEKYTKDPKGALFDFVEIIMGASKEEYFEKHLKRNCTPQEKREILKILQAYKYVSFAFSSDGWFFAEISGIEAVKNLLFAKRALDLLGNKELEENFLQILSYAPSNIQVYGNGLGVFQKLVLPQVVFEKDLITSITALKLSDLIPQEGFLGKFYYKVEGFEPWKVYLRDEETGEEFEKVEHLRDFNPEKLPQPLFNWLLRGWAIKYFEEDTEFERDYEVLFENLLYYAHGKRFDGYDLLKDRVAIYLRTKLYLSTRDLSPLSTIREIFERADTFGINLRDEEVKFWLERYMGQRILKGMSEEEAKELAMFVKDYNLLAGRFEFMVSLWGLQNWAWENKEKLKAETLKLLDFQVE